MSDLYFGFQEAAAVRPPTDKKAKMEEASDFSLEAVLDTVDTKPQTATVSQEDSSLHVLGL